MVAPPLSKFYKLEKLTQAVASRKSIFQGSIRNSFFTQSAQKKQCSPTRYLCLKGSWADISRKLGETFLDLLTTKPHPLTTNHQGKRLERYPSSAIFNIKFSYM